MERLGAWLVVAGVLSLGAEVSAQGYVGANRCRSCHAFEYQVWAAGPHARAHTSLTAEQLRDAKCSSCHTMVPDDASASMAGVQCERCHGGGRYYHPSFVMRDAELARAVGLVEPGDAQCRQCHTDATPSIVPFDFASWWKRIDHGSAAREAWEKARAALAPIPVPKP